MKSLIRIACSIAAVSICLAQDPGGTEKVDSPDAGGSKGSNSISDVNKSLNGIQVIAGSLMEGLDKVQKDAHKKTSDLVKRSEELLDRQEKQAKRFDKILDTWERQQAQYQKYLDSLEKK